VQNSASTGLSDEPVTFTRRLFGQLLESILLSLPFLVWLIWFVIVAPKGRSPAKQLLYVRILEYKTGRVASVGRVWIREVGKLMPAIVAAVDAIVSGSLEAAPFFSLYYVAGGALIFFTRERRALWDLLAGTVVRYQGGAPDVTDEIRERNAIASIEAQNAGITNM
jgi:uncharacterized RDD family membrane protein YckC